MSIQPAEVLELTDKVSESSAPAVSSGFHQPTLIEELLAGIPRVQTRPGRPNLFVINGRSKETEVLPECLNRVERKAWADLLRTWALGIHFRKASAVLLTSSNWAKSESVSF